jgi:hypothetical protein
MIMVLGPMKKKAEARAEAKAARSRDDETESSLPGPVRAAARLG